jgi:membrane protease YdiL (CAAX protease family)
MSHLFSKFRKNRFLFVFLLAACLYWFIGPIAYAYFGLDRYLILHLCMAILWLVVYEKGMNGRKIVRDDDPWLKMPVLTVIYLFVFIFIYLFGILNVAGNIRTLFQQNGRIIFPSVVLAVSTGIFEETLFRGFLSSYFMQLCQKKKYPLFLTCLFSSVAFGLVHLTNLSGSNLHDVMIQVFYACMIGMSLFAMRVLGNGMALPILVHSLIDMQAGIMDTAPAAGPFLPYLIIFLPLGLCSLGIVYRLEKKNGMIL